MAFTRNYAYRLEVANFYDSFSAFWEMKVCGFWSMVARLILQGIDGRAQGHLAGSDKVRIDRWIAP